jgi:putative FmdB family regulatory protein
MAMPIYEFYCEKCNTLFKFLSRTVNTEKIPDCPCCKDVKLERRMSLFATVSGNKEGEGGDDMPPLDEAKVERAMSMLASEGGNVNEEDPRKAASLMRKLSDATGLKMGAGMEEALSRLERGEDPEQVEQEMGDVLEGEDPFSFEDKSRKSNRKSQPEVDETLYEL